MRDKLIELKRKFVENFNCGDCQPENDKCRKCLTEKETDYLIENGIICLPCKVGDIVYCDICNKGKGYLDECIIKSIEFNSDWREPLFTAICYERAEYQTYWASDFGKTIFFEPKFNDKKKPRKH